jgi:hypothetical protein
MGGAQEYSVSARNYQVQHSFQSHLLAQSVAVVALVATQ